jgi:hypothetical protein
MKAARISAFSCDDREVDMIDIEDSRFFAQREATQRRLAAQAVDPAIAAIHIQMADDYAARIPRKPRPQLRIII